MTASKTVIKQLEEIDWDFAGYNPNGRGTGIHNIHWYPAPFPPAVAGTLIDILGSQSNSFLDPFSGSSVAPLEAWFRGKRVVGIDNNRFAVNVANAKVQFVTQGTPDTAKRLFEEYHAFRKAAMPSWSKMRVDNICEKAQIQHEAIKWFIQPVLAEIAVIKTWILHGGKLSSAWRNSLITTLSSLLHGRFSIARNYHYTYVVDNSRVKEEALEKVDVQGIFANKLLDNMIQGQLAREQLIRISQGLNDIQEPVFINNQAQNIAEFVNDSVDLIVTSPPYFGMNDYVRSQYLSWLVFQWEGYEEDLEAESGSRRRRNSMSFYRAYFADMRKAFEGIYQVLERRGYLALVLGSSTTKLAREIDPLVELASHLEDIGFVRVWAGKRRVRFRKINNTPYRDEVIWVFQR